MMGRTFFQSQSPRRRKSGNLYHCVNINELVHVVNLVPRCMNLVLLSPFRSAFSWFFSVYMR